MKIFRTDGSGTVNKTESLLKVIGKIIDKVGLINGLIDNIESIEDKKGVLTVSLLYLFIVDIEIYFY